MADLLNDLQFDKFRKLIYDSSGITFSENNRSILDSRLKDRLREEKLVNVDDYYNRVISDQTEFKAFLDSVTTNLTRFFRNQPHFDALINYVIPHVIEQKKKTGDTKIKIWSAGCSTGEEVYSVLMGLLDYVPIERIELLATDYNETLLETVRAGEYSVRCYHETPERYRKYEQLNEKATRFQMPPEICAAVRAERLDLLTDEYPADFDVILCRNVLKFFNRQQIPLVQAKLAASLVPGGFLFTATDDQHNGLELVADPPSMGLTQLDGRCIYRKG